MDTGEATKLTVYIGDSFRYGRKKLYRARILDLSADLPVVVVAIDRSEKIEAVLPKLDAMIEKGLVTTERVWVVLSRPVLSP